MLPLVAVDTPGSRPEVRLFHGVNVVFKQAPYVPSTEAWDPELSFSAKDAKDLRSWGFNLIRLGVLWSGTYPANPDTPDPAYMQAVQTIVDLCAAEGIYVIVDMHSDLLSRRFCGNGIPDWAVDRALQGMGQSPPYGDFPMPVSSSKGFFEAADPSKATWHAEHEGHHTALEVAELNAKLYPKVETCLGVDGGFFPLYWANATVSTFQALYENAGGIRDGLEKHWKLVATELASKPAVLMYDLINEPEPGRNMIFPQWSGGLRWFFGNSHFEQRVLVPFYKKLAAAIRSVDHRHILGVEPLVTFTTTSLGGPVDDPKYSGLEALSWHLYCAVAPDKAMPVFEKLFCSMLNTMSFWAAIDSMRTQGVGGVLSEYGSLGNTSDDLEELKRVGDLADDFLTSRTYWQYKNYKDLTSTGGYGALTFFQNGELQENKLKALATPYALTVAGQPHFMRFDRASGAFVLDYTTRHVTDPNHDTKAERTSELFLGLTMHYPKGFHILTNVDKGKLELHLRESFLEVRHASSLVGQQVVLCVVPCGGAKQPACGGLAPSVGPWHPCAVRLVGFWWYVAWACSMLVLVEFTLFRCIGRRFCSCCLRVGEEEGYVELQKTQAEEAQEQRLRQRQHVALKVLFFIASVVCVVSSLASLGLPFRDDFWRWLIVVMLLAPFLFAVSATTAVRSPGIGAAFFILMALWRLMHFVLDMAGDLPFSSILAVQAAVLMSMGCLLFICAFKLPRCSVRWRQRLFRAVDPRQSERDPGSIEVVSREAWGQRRP